MTYHVQFLLLVLAGWVNRQQQDVIDSCKRRTVSGCGNGRNLGQRLAAQSLGLDGEPAPVVVRETETLAPKPGSEHNTPERALGLGPDLRCHVARLRVCRLRLGFRVYNESILGRQNGNPGEKPSNGRIAVKVINHLGDEVMKVFRVNR